MTVLRLDKFPILRVILYFVWWRRIPHTGNEEKLQIGYCLAGVTFQQLVARCACADPSAFVLVRCWIPHLGCCAKRGLPIMGLVCLPLPSRAVPCRSSQHFLPFHSLVDILNLKFGARTANLWRNSWIPGCQIQDRYCWSALQECHVGQTAP